MFRLPDRFRLHDCVRRRITLAIFLLGCVAPTAVVLAWGVSRWLPWHTKAEASRLGRELGLRVSLEKVHHPRPGVVRYEGLRLCDPETGQTLFRCGLMEAAWDRPKDSKGPAAASLLLVATEPEIEEAVSKAADILELAAEEVFSRREMSHDEPHVVSPGGRKRPSYWTAAE